MMQVLEGDLHIFGMSVAKLAIAGIVIGSVQIATGDISGGLHTIFYGFLGQKAGDALGPFLKEAINIK